MQPQSRKAELGDLPLIAPEELREGDLLFFSSSGGLQALCDLVGDIWIHVAVVVLVDGELRTVEAGTPAHVGSRRLLDLPEVYESIGVGRPNLSEQCRQGAVVSAKRQLSEQTPNSYPWDDFLTAAVILLTRKNFPVAHLDRLDAALGALLQRCGELNERSRTCSYFVHQVFGDLSGPCELTVPLTPGPAVSTRSPAMEATPPTFASFAASSASQQAELLAEFSLLEMVCESPATSADPLGIGPAERGMNGSWTTPEQFLRFVRATGEFLYSLVNRPEGRTGTGFMSGRWVTPTDLWDSPQIGYRALLKSN